MSKLKQIHAAIPRESGKAIMKCKICYTYKSKLRNSLKTLYFYYWDWILKTSLTCKEPFQKVCHRSTTDFSPPPPLSHFVTICLYPPPPCHHPNSAKLFDPKLADKSLELCLTEHIRMPKSFTEWQQKSKINKKTMFYVFKTPETVTFTITLAKIP